MGFPVGAHHTSYLQAMGPPTALGPDPQPLVWKSGSIAGIRSLLSDARGRAGKAVYPFVEDDIVSPTFTIQWGTFPKPANCESRAKQYEKKIDPDSGKHYTWVRGSTRGAVYEQRGQIEAAVPNKGDPATGATGKPASWWIPTTRLA